MTFCSCGEQGLLFIVVSRLLIAVPFVLLWSTGSSCLGFSRCSTQAQWLWLRGSRASAQQLWCTGLVAPQYVESSQTRDWTCIPCVGWWVFIHWATREVQSVLLQLFLFSLLTFRNSNYMYIRITDALLMF